MLTEFKRLVKDCAQSANGDYDPARVIGYSVSILGALVFLALTVYITVITKTFDASGFAIGLGGISTTVAAAAAGVWIKKSTEIPLDTSVPTSEEVKS